MKTRISQKAGVLGICMIVALFAMTLAPAQGEAQVLAVGSMGAPVLFADPVPHFLPINGGATFLNFATTVANQRVVVFFNAECAVKGTDRNTQVNVDVLIDGVVAPPSNGDDVFCADLGDNLLHHWARPSINVWRIIPQPGVHQVRVVSRMFNFNAGDQYRLDDSSTIVMR
jgi:hypothetical protein